MANYAVSVLATGQAVVTSKYAAPETRRKVPTVMELALQNQSISIPNAQELRVSPLRPVDINYFTNVAAGSATAKVAVHTGTYGDSGKINVTYVTHVETFSLPRKLAYNSILTYQMLFNNLYEQKWKNLRTRHDTSALAFLYANRMQLSKATVDAQIASAFPSGIWNETNFAAEIPQADKTRFAQKIKIFLAARYFTGQYDIIADLQTAAEMEFQFQQGIGNATNLTWQQAGLNIGTTQDQIDSNYAAGTVLAMPAGLFAGLVWNEGLNRQGVNAGENSVGSLGTIRDPFAGPVTDAMMMLPEAQRNSGVAIADISMYTARADTSANTTGGSTQDIVDQWELSLTIGYVAPPLSTAGDSVIHEIAQMT
ncbi:MAG: hypothetical protein Q8941_20505 [Bacteroidota bacterium]|nr:hypothetical protein [Bacteroidota bacterium]